MSFFERNISSRIILPGLIFLIIFCLTLFSCSPPESSTASKSAEDELKAELENLQAEYDYLNEKFSKQKEAYIDTLRSNEKLTDDIESRDEEIKALENEIVDLEKKLLGTADGVYIEELSSRVERLTELLKSINSHLKRVYIGSSDPEEINYTFTAFSIRYNGKHYIITAGHCVADNYGDAGRFRFKANFSDDWIYPELIGYKAEFWNLDDYAVFYSEDVKDGFEISGIETTDNYLPGSIDKGLSVFRHLGDSSRRGESGSPVINEYGEVIGIYVVYGLVYTPIQLALDIIDEYEQTK